MLFQEYEAMRSDFCSAYEETYPEVAKIISNSSALTGELNLKTKGADAKVSHRL